MSKYNYVGSKVKKIYLHSCSDDEIQTILDKQADEPLFKIIDLKHGGAHSDYVWIYYDGEFPEKENKR